MDMDFEKYGKNNLESFLKINPEYIFFLRNEILKDIQLSNSLISSLDIVDERSLTNHPLLLKWAYITKEITAASSSILKTHDILLNIKNCTDLVHDEFLQRLCEDILADKIVTWLKSHEWNEDMLQFPSLTSKIITESHTPMVNVSVGTPFISSPSSYLSSTGSSINEPSIHTSIMPDSRYQLGIYKTRRRRLPRFEQTVLNTSLNTVLNTSSQDVVSRQHPDPNTKHSSTSTSNFSHDIRGGEVNHLNHKLIDNQAAVVLDPFEDDWEDILNEEPILKTVNTLHSIHQHTVTPHINFNPTQTTASSIVSSLRPPSISSKASVTPSSTTPSSTTPSSTIPSSTIPSSTTPSSTILGESSPTPHTPHQLTPRLTQPSTLPPHVVYVPVNNPDNPSTPNNPSTPSNHPLTLKPLKPLNSLKPSTVPSTVPVSSHISHSSPTLTSNHPHKTNLPTNLPINNLPTNLHLPLSTVSEAHKEAHKGARKETNIQFPNLTFPSNIPSNTQHKPVPLTIPHTTTQTTLNTPLTNTQTTLNNTHNTPLTTTQTPLTTHTTTQTPLNTHTTQISLLSTHRVTPLTTQTPLLIPPQSKSTLPISPILPNLVSNHTKTPIFPTTPNQTPITSNTTTNTNQTTTSKITPISSISLTSKTTSSITKPNTIPFPSKTSSTTSQSSNTPIPSSYIPSQTIPVISKPKSTKQMKSPPLQTDDAWDDDQDWENW